MTPNTTRLAVAAALALALAPPALAGEQAAGKPAEKKPSPAEVLRGLGLDVAQQLAAFDLSEAELAQVLAGVKDGHGGKVKLELDAEQQKARTELLRERQGRIAARYLTKAAAEKGAVKTASGLVFIPVKEGAGAAPVAADKVKVHYTGRLTDGTVFDSSVQRGQPAEFPLANVIPCWTEGVQKIKVGGKARLVCPSAIAYGERGTPGGPIPPGATLDFDVELLDIVK